MPPTPSSTDERLRDTIARRMRMSHVYQPLMLNLAELDQVKHPNFGGLSQGVEIALAAVTLPVLRPLLVVGPAHGRGGSSRG